MSSIPVAPSSLNGIKRRAKSLGRERKIPHHEALDLVAGEAGFQNIRHAQNHFAKLKPLLYTAYLTAYWSEGRTRGRETLTVQIPCPLTDIVARHQLQTRSLWSFRLESTDHLERKLDTNSQEQAHKELFAAVRTLRFMAVTGLKPATTIKQRRPLERFESLPGRDHMSEWFHTETGVWVYMDEPYSKPNLELRSGWASEHGLQMITPEWEGLYFPGSSIPYLFCEDSKYATQLTGQLSKLQLGVRTPVWNGESASYYSQFVSPAREATGKARSPRPMPTYPGIAIGGAIPYGARTGGAKSSWRPEKKMPLKMHLTVGPLLHALINSKLPQTQRSGIAYLRTTLDDWLMMEYPDAKEMTAEQFHDAYYGTHREPIRGRQKQIKALRRITVLLQKGYADCKPQRKMVKVLGEIEAALAESL